MQSHAPEDTLHQPVDQMNAADQKSGPAAPPHMPIVQLEISADGFEVTQNSVKFLPHGIQFSVVLPSCKQCSQAKYAHNSS